MPAVDPYHSWHWRNEPGFWRPIGLGVYMTWWRRWLS
jgi:hypothetical protein